MSGSLSWLYVFTIFLLTTWSIFSGFLGVTTDQTEALQQARERQAERLRTLVSISSTTSSGDGYITAVRNQSKRVSFGDFGKIDVFARYSDACEFTIAKRLAYPSEWTVSSITGDDFNPNMWDPGETANFSFSLNPKPKAGNKGTVALAVPQGITDSAYFDSASTGGCQLYWHNDPTPPTGDTLSHLVLPMGGAKPSAITLYNYNTNRDTNPGLLIKKGGSGAGETDPTKHQVWRTASLERALTISGDVSIDFWSRANADVQVTVTIYLRDYDGVSSYTEIGNGSVSDLAWPIAFTKKTITISGLNYTIPLGHQLEAKVIWSSVLGSDMWFAYDTTAYPSVIKLP